MLRIKYAIPLTGYRLRLTLTDGSIVERDVNDLLQGPVFESIRRDPELFRHVKVERGTLSWPGDIDLCPDVILWNGPPPEGQPGVTESAPDRSLAK
jgi:Protein of unknown function (DUF2442)